MSTPAASTTARRRRVVRGDHHERRPRPLRGDDVGRECRRVATRRLGHLVTSAVQGTHGSRRHARHCSAASRAAPRAARGGRAAASPAADQTARGGGRAARGAAGGSSGSRGTPRRRSARTPRASASSLLELAGVRRCSGRWPAQLVAVDVRHEPHVAGAAHGTVAVGAARRRCGRPGAARDGRRRRRGG